MRIGYVLGDFPKLSETFVLNELVELLEKGNKVYIFSFGRPFENITQKEINDYDLLKKTYYFDSSYIIEGLKSLTDLTNFRLFISREKLLTKFACIVRASNFSKIIRELGIEILHSHFANQPTFTNLCISQLTDLPFTFTGHAFDIFIAPNVKALRERMEKSSAVITPSYYNRDYLHNLTGISPEKIHVVRACSNIERFKSIARDEDGFTILTVGRLVQKKGIAYGILAIKELIKEFPRIHYKIIGSGPLEHDLKELVESLNLQNNVSFLGSLDGNSLMDELSRATIFVLPCIKADNGDLDGCPLTLQEAMIAQVPVISSNIASIPELIENGKEGFLIESKNVEQLGCAIKTLLEDKALRIKMGENGRKKIKEEFNIHTEVDKLLEIWGMLKG